MKLKHFRVAAREVAPGDMMIEPQGAYRWSHVQRVLLDDDSAMIHIAGGGNLILRPETMVSVWRWTPPRRAAQ
jgi:hypothetical protein